MGNFAILNTDMLVIGLYEGDINNVDISGYENYGGAVKYSEPYGYRGTPQIGSKWEAELDKFVL